MSPNRFFFNFIVRSRVQRAPDPNKEFTCTPIRYFIIPVFIYLFISFLYKIMVHINTALWILSLEFSQLLNFISFYPISCEIQNM